MKERSYLFDNIKAFLVFSMVLAHFLKQNPDFSLDTPGGAVYFMIFTYIMQGFFLISGYFSKNLEKSQNGAVKNLLLPYVLMVAIVSFISYGITGNFRGDLIEPSFALWFLFAMFVFRLTLKGLVEIPGLLYISMALYLIAGQIPFLDDRFTGSRICCFLMFFVIGYYLQEKQIAWLRRVNHGFMTLIIIGLVGAGVLISVFDMMQTNLLFLEQPYADFGLTWYQGMGIRIFLALYFFAVMIVIINLMPDRKLFFSEIGQRTMTVYLLHIPFRYAMKYTDLSGSGGIDSYVIALVLAIAVTWLFSRKPVFDAYGWVIDKAYMPIDFVWQKMKKQANAVKKKIEENKEG